jgi:hypothetical protein
MCYCCSEKCVRITMILLGVLLVVPGIILFILGGILNKQV